VPVPLPGVLARIRAADGEAELGADSEIQLRGTQVFAGYWHNLVATEAAFTLDGWFHTGDIGAVDPITGHLRIRGRTKKMIITGGLNVYPREVEIVLEEHPAASSSRCSGCAPAAQPTSSASPSTPPGLGANLARSRMRAAGGCAVGGCGPVRGVNFSYGRR
jgi:acyl-CoA synthetase (AMP-forming)/AMP-acid ligase II